jgi:hypothetical protein
MLCAGYFAYDLVVTQKSEPKPVKVSFDVNEQF